MLCTRALILLNQRQGLAGIRITSRRGHFSKQIQKRSRRGWNGRLIGALSTTLVLLAPLGVGARESHAILDAALVVALLDAEVALLTPVRVPRVGHLPVLLGALHAPADTPASNLREADDLFRGL